MFLTLKLQITLYIPLHLQSMPFCHFLQYYRCVLFVRLMFQWTWRCWDQQFR